MVQRLFNLTIAENIAALWHGQRGGIRALAQSLDPSHSRHKITTWCEGAQIVYHFYDGSTLITHGRGRTHYIEYLSGAR